MDCKKLSSLALIALAGHLTGPPLHIFLEFLLLLLLLLMPLLLLQHLSPPCPFLICIFLLFLLSITTLLLCSLCLFLLLLLLRAWRRWKVDAPLPAALLGGASGRMRQQRCFRLYVQGCAAHIHGVAIEIGGQWDCHRLSRGCTAACACSSSFGFCLRLSLCCQVLPKSQTRIASGQHIGPHVLAELFHHAAHIRLVLLIMLHVHFIVAIQD
mmetsp:Transcript_19504/g.50649  ORF Transcript_19504/g.50649 Transcript_19504/m.50649 type:complete len:212 (-) Transcript_19504:1252-1887(-)